MTRWWKKLAAIAGAMTMGHGLDDPDLGPLISARQMERVEGFVERAKAAGQTCAFGGHRVSPEGLENGLFYPPTVFTDVPRRLRNCSARGVRTCPVHADLRRRRARACSLRTATNFGLVAGIYTADTTQAMRFARRVDAGQVFVNGFLQGGDTIPFGGVKESGIGREKGLAGLAAYCATKSIVLNH